MRKSDIKKIIDTYSAAKDEYIVKNEKEHEVTFYLADNPLTTLTLTEDKDYIRVMHCEDGVIGNTELWQICQKGVRLYGVTTRDDTVRESAELRRYRIENDNMHMELAKLRKQLEESQNKKETKTNNKEVSKLKRDNAELLRLLKESQNRKETYKGGRKKASDKIDIELFKQMIADNADSKEIMSKFGISRATYFRLKKELVN